MSEQVPSKDMSRHDALRILGGWAKWSSPNEPDAELRAAARAVLHDRLALIRQIEEMRVAAATAAQERAENEPAPVLSELERAAMHFVDIVLSQRSPYITETGRHQGSGGPWAELVDAAHAQARASSETKEGSPEFLASVGVCPECKTIAGFHQPNCGAKP